MALALKIMQAIRYTTDDGENSATASLQCNISTQAGAKSAITRLDSVLETIAQQLAVFGAVQNRLSASIANLSSSSVMTQAAIGRIMDANYSTEMAKLTKSGILSEAANHVLSGTISANQIW